MENSSEDELELDRQFQRLEYLTTQSEHLSAERLALGPGIGEGLRQVEVEVCLRIRQQRIRSGLSQMELAEDMTAFGFDMQQSTIAKIEAGKRALRLAELYGLAVALNVPVLSLLVDPEAPRVSSLSERPMADLERMLADQEAAKRRVESEMFSQLKAAAKSFAGHETRAQMLAAQMRVTGAAATRKRRATGDESPS